MEARRCVEFTNVELAGDMELVLWWRRPQQVPWRRLWWAGGAAEREKDGLPCSSTEEMPTGGAEARWRGRSGGEGRAVAKAARRSVTADSCRSATVR
jgi:hypothetical protein